MKLYNQDCLETLKTIPDNSIDLVVTDCPYLIVQGGCTNLNLGFRGFTDNYNNIKKGKIFKHNDIKFSEWLPELYRVVKPQTHIYIYISARNIKELQQEAEKVGFTFQQIIIWKKNNTTPNRYYLNSYEMILMLRKGKAKSIKNMGTKNILEINNILGGKKTHPTEKPVELNKILIENSSNEGQVVLDPFMGTGSTGVAARELKRDFIGIEIDEKYFNIAKERLSTEQLKIKEVI